MYMLFKKLLPILLLLVGFTTYGQRILPVTVAELAPQYGIPQQMLENDGEPLLQYINTLKISSTAKSDTCITINSRLVTMYNSILYDYRRRNDTLWIDPSHYIENETQSIQMLQRLSERLLAKAHDCIEGEHRRHVQNQQMLCDLRRDTIERNHRTIIHTCDAIGVSDKKQRQQLKDLYYAYLSVYNRYNFNTIAPDSSSLQTLAEFCRFQQSIIDNLVGNGNFRAQIESFAPRLKQLCEKSHSEVYRSFLRFFPQAAPPIRFSTIEEYYSYLKSLQQMMAAQQLYIETINLQNSIVDEGKHINILYFPTFHDAADTYRKVEASLNMTPSFSNYDQGETFIGQLREFAQVQQHYLCDYLRLIDIRDHADSIIRSCSFRYGNIAKAYRTLNKKVFATPAYRTLYDAQRYSETLDDFETLQRQYDTILIQLQLIDQLTDSVRNRWASHFNIFKGLKKMQQQVIFVPSHVTPLEGSRFIRQLDDHIALLNKCIETNQRIDQYNDLSDQFRSATSRYGNLRKAVERIEITYVNVCDINNREDLDRYCQQLKDYAVVQQHLVEVARSNDAVTVNARLQRVRDIELIKMELQIPNGSR